MSFKVSIVGYLGGEPELRYTPAGTPVTRFSVASNRQYTPKDGVAKKETTWARVSAWRGLGESCAKFLSKGRQVRVEGRPVPDLATGGPRIWVGNDGISRASYEIIATEVEFLGANPNGNASEEPDEGPAIEPTEDEAPF